MFDLDYYTELEEFQMIGYFAEQTGITLQELATLFEMEPDLLATILRTGFVPDDLPDHDELYEVLHRFLSLMSYLQKIGHYDSEKMHQLWTDVIRYRSTLVKPPWYAMGLKAYLLAHKRQGMETALKWIWGL